MLAGRALEFADLARSSVLPRSIADGRELSSDGRDDAGDFGMLKFVMCDLERESIDGLVGSANSGFSNGLAWGLSNVRGWLKARLW